MKITIRFASYQVEAELYDTPTGRAIYDALPLHENVSLWGDEIYFEIPVETGLEAEARPAVSNGDLAYWPNMPAFCIFFGPTPVSSGETPVAASAVNVFGRLITFEPEMLRKVTDNAKVTVTRSE
jgi:hypothetical protein